MADEQNTRDKVEGFMASTFGIGLGSVELRVVQTRLSMGDVVRGRIGLKLGEASEAKRMIVRLRAVQLVGRIETRSTATSTGSRRTEDSRAGLVFSENEIYQHDHEVDGARIYLDGDAFDFAVHLPKSVALQTPDNAVAKAAKFINDVMSPVQGQVKWFVQARLVLAWHKKDLKREVQIQVE